MSAVSRMKIKVVCWTFILLECLVFQHSFAQGAFEMAALVDLAVVDDRSGFDIQV